MMRFDFRSTTIAVMIAVAASNTALAEPLVVEADQSMMMVISSTPGAIVIGNPMIADATVQGDKLLIHGRAFGTTNIIILDQSGEQIATYDVSVKHEVDNVVAVYKGQSTGATRFSYNCAPTCNTELQIGDNALYNETLVKQIENKIKLATGQTDAKSEAPAAPQ